MKYFILLFVSAVVVVNNVQGEQEFNNYQFVKRTVKHSGKGRLPLKTIKAGDRIAFGSDVDKMTAEKKALFTHQVRLESSNRFNPGRALECGGSLITDSYVLTAAHCLHGYSYNAVLQKDEEYEAEYTHLYFGIRSLRDRSLPNTVKRTSYPNLYNIHSNWNPPNSFQSDVALIKLDVPVVPQPNVISIIPLPSDADCKRKIISRTALISGWGLMEKNIRTTDLKAAEIKISPHDVCAGFEDEYNSDRHICASGVNWQNTCQGDSGGPMTITNSNLVQILIGVTSYGDAKCDDGTPGVFSSTCAYKNWINEAIIAPLPRTIRTTKKPFENYNKF